MADMLDPRCAIGALRILTRADQGGWTLSTGPDKCRFDQLLIGNAKALDMMLETDPEYASLKSGWKNNTKIKIPHPPSSRWHFVLYCLKTLNLLHESLKSSLEEYKKQKLENIRPSEAPPVSPDTLSFEEQKVVLTAVQFIVCLGISPNLDSGVGIPIEMRSEFIKLIQLSSDEGKLAETEKQWRLYMCLKVFVSCIFTPSLGSVILSRHLTDILAGLLQLTHSLKSPASTKTPEVSDVGKQTSKVCDVEKQFEKSAGNTELGNAKVNELGEKELSSRETIDKKSVIKSTDDKIAHISNSRDTNLPPASEITADLPPASEITPASIVDHVRKQFQETETSTRKSKLENAKESADNKHDLNNLDEELKNDKESISKSGSTNLEEVNRHGKDDFSSEQDVDVGFCEKILEDLLEKIYPPLLVKTLLLLQGGPQPKKMGGGKRSLPPAPVWLRKICGKQLTSVMMKPKGVQSVLRGMLDSPGEGQGMSQASDWRKCDAVAKVIACCPLQSFSVESYYKTIGPQILEILHIPDKQVAKQFLRVACSTISNMAAQYPDLTRQYVILPLIQPLLSCTENSECVIDSIQPCVLIDEAQLSLCVEDCHRVFVSGTTANPQLTQWLQPVVLTLFQLLLFTKSGVSALKTACHELIVCYLKQTELQMTLTCLELMAFQTCRTVGDSFVKMHPNVAFSHGSSGGVVAIYDPERSVDRQSQDVCVQCMVEILKDLQTDGTSGEFLIYMLQELTAILKSEVEGESIPAKSSCSEGELLVEIETDNQSKEEQFYRKLMLLNLLASVCESIGPSCIKNTKNTLEFVRATLERAVQVCKATADPVFEVFENETLTMAMGLLTAVLTGAMQVTTYDRKTMENLLPLLQDICDNHPESSVQEMASDLRIAIATHGAVWSEIMRSNAEEFKELKTKIQQSVGKQKGKTTTKPVIQMISDSSSESVKTESENRQKSVARKTKEECDISETEQKKELNKTDPSVGMKHQKTIHLHMDDNTDIKRTIDTVDKNQKIEATLFETPESGIKLDKTSTEIIKDNKDLDSEVKDTAKSVESGKEPSELEEAFKELCDPLLPVRGHGLIRLTRLVQSRGKEAYDRKDTILKIFEENLDHTDSYMYLSSVNGLAAMAELFPDLVVPRICEEFGNVGEEKKRSSKLRMKLGEIMVKASRNLGDTIPKYRDLLINTVLTGAKDSDGLVRASSLSNLGEICKLLHFSMGNIVHEVFLCCKSLLKSDSDPEVRKAAAVALTLLLQGLGPDILKVLDTVLLDLYRLLKQVMTSEKDEGVRLNANLALNELEDIMKSVLFPQQKLEKRIRVLDME